MDKIMLGLLTEVTEVGYYENAEKIINIPLTLITALGTVMLPRISNMVAKGDKEKISLYINKSITFVMFMSFAMCFGLIAIGYNFAPLFFGKEFQKTGILIMMLATTLPFLSFANVLRTQYLIPNEKDKIYIKSVSLGAISNLIINFIFIPKLGSIGACIGTIIAEAVVMIYQTVSVRNELIIINYLKSIIPYFIKALIMFICIYPLNFINMNSIIRLFLQIIIGASIYCLLNIKYILEIFNISKILNKLKKY
jgi:O-antigen/teichoic acid export membrane protein